MLTAMSENYKNNDRDAFDDESDDWDNKSGNVNTSWHSDGKTETERGREGGDSLGKHLLVSTDDMWLIYWKERPTWQSLKKGGQDERGNIYLKREKVGGRWEVIVSMWDVKRKNSEYDNF